MKNYCSKMWIMWKVIFTLFVYIDYYKNKNFSKFCFYGTMICNILDNTTELYMIKYTFGEIFSSWGETLYKNSSDQTVNYYPLANICHMCWTKRQKFSVKAVSNMRWDRNIAHATFYFTKTFLLILIFMYTSLVFTLEK